MWETLQRSFNAIGIHDQNLQSYRAYKRYIYASMTI